jgi:hypothetical protein
MTDLELLRTLKSMQTTTLTHQAALDMMGHREPAESDLRAELSDAVNTAQTHIEALDHAITLVTARMK